MKKIDLTKQYTEEIESWDWETAKTDCQLDEYPTPPEHEDDSAIGRAYIGSVMSIMPSGKYYMPWCTNQTCSDVIKDSLFLEILESIASRYGLWLEAGEGCSTDLFLASPIN